MKGSKRPVGGKIDKKRKKTMKGSERPIGGIIEKNYEI